ncbi:MAG: hypothetical protein HY909_13525 [Deltaproteobacteria bacterium]|nr:hypothetical protein [Deltaproteobacteria bacterium]
MGVLRVCLLGLGLVVSSGACLPPGPGGGTDAGGDADSSAEVTADSSAEAAADIAVEAADVSRGDTTAPADTSTALDAPRDSAGMVDAVTDGARDGTTDADAVGGGPDAVVTDAAPDVGDARVTPPPSGPRPVSPLSDHRVTRRRPTLRWALGEGDGAFVQLCRDRACADRVLEFEATGTSGAPPTPLAPGVYFWRFFERVRGARAATPSIPWHFRVDARDTAVDSASAFGADVNNDRFQDIVMLASPLPTELPRAVVVFLGGPTGPGRLPDQRLPADYGGPLQDVNGDGYGDVSVAGALHLGGPSGLAPTSAGMLPSLPSTPAFGSPVGDVHGDGYADLMVTAGAIGGARPTMAIFPGGPTGLSPTPRHTQSTDFFSFSSDVFGRGAGDTNGDGLGDAVFSVYVLGGLSAARVLLARPVGDWVSAPGGCFTEAGSDGVPVGDVNGDGYIDLAMHCGGALDGISNPYTSVQPGGPSGTTTTGALDFGVRGVSALGDVNGDGCADLLVRERMPTPWGGATALPRGALYHGVPGATVRATMVRAVDLTDVGLYPVGDVNGDSYDDVLRVSPRAAELFYGSSTGLALTPGATLALTP